MEMTDLIKELQRGYDGMDGHRMHLSLRPGRLTGSWRSHLAAEALVLTLPVN